jgi:hypothetical protein
MKYNSHPVVTDPAGHCTYFSPHYQHRRVMLNDFWVYHYGYARNNMDEIMKQKQEYYEKELAIHGAANVKFDQKVKDWFASMEPVLHFSGEHPEIMKQHPMWNNQGAKEASPSWRDDPFYSQVLNNQEYGNIWLCMTGQAQPAMPKYHNGMTVGDLEFFGSCAAVSC